MPGRIVRNLALPLVLAAALAAVIATQGHAALPRAPHPTAAATKVLKAELTSSGTTTSSGAPGSTGGCPYPMNYSQVYGAKSGGGSSWGISGWFHQNGCNIPHQPVTITCHNGSHYSATTDGNGDWTLAGLPAAAFPVIVSYAGSSAVPPATPYTIK